MVKERDEMINELKMRRSEQIDRLAQSSDEKERDWQEQRAVLEQHYRQIIAEISSRNEVISRL